MFNINFFISETCGWHADLPLEVSLLSFSGITEGSYSYRWAVCVIAEDSYSNRRAFSV